MANEPKPASFDITSDNRCWLGFFLFFSFYDHSSAGGAPGGNIAASATRVPARIQTINCSRNGVNCSRNGAPGTDYVTVLIKACPRLERG